MLDYKTRPSDKNRRIAPQVDALLQAAGLPLLDYASVEFGRVARKFLLATQEVTRIESERWNGIYKNGSAKTTATHTAPRSTAPATPAGKLFSEVLRLYCKENPRAARSEMQMRSEFVRFVAVLGGDKPINTITKELVRRYKEGMLQDRKLTQATCVKHL